MMSNYTDMQYKKVAAVGSVASGRGTSFVASFALASNRLNVVAVAIILVSHVGVLGHHVPCQCDFMFALARKRGLGEGIRKNIECTINSNYSERRPPYVYQNCLFLGYVREVHGEQENNKANFLRTGYVCLPVRSCLSHCSLIRLSYGFISVVTYLSVVFVYFCF